MKHTFLLIFSIFSIFTINAQNNKGFRVNGYVRDSSSGEELIGANVFDETTGNGGITNSYGFFSLNLKAGEHTISFSFVGYNMVKMNLIITSDTNLIIELPKKSKASDAVTINANRKDNIRKIDMSTNKLSMQTIKKLPAFLGEIDLVRSIQLLPGVSTVGEGASGFNVRGGGIDQNLVLLDEAPVFNSSHLFGFFSIFNPDAVKDVQLVKAGIPANYGGRLSSILDVRMKEGNKKAYEFNGGIGTIFSRFTAEGPLIKNKASFIVGGRRSYIDVLAKPFLKGDLAGSRFNFYDFTAKVNYIMGPKDKFYISTYFGNDVFSASSAFKFIWGNKTLTARWNHVFSRKIFSNFTYVYSKYNYNLGFGSGTNTFDWYSNIFNNTFKPEFTWYINQNNTVQFGGQSTYYLFRPGRAKTNTQDFSLPDKFSWDNSAYIQNEQKVGKKWQFRYGLRFTSFEYMGKGNAYYYKPSSLGLQRAEFDTSKYFGKNKNIKTYNNFEPRFSAKYELNKFSSIKVSYNRMVQNLHLISNTTASVPLDVWTPSTNNIKPEIADQYAAGYFRNFGKNDDFEFSSEVYYKDLQNQVDYVNGANLLLNEYLEGELLYGKGRAYGLELYLKKNTGKLTGWVSYTIARTERKVETINNFEWYPSRYDRLHNLYVVAIYSPNKKWDFSGNFIYSSGTPNTFPTMQYTFQGLNIPHNDIGARNNSRISPYIRLDFAVTMQGKQREKYSCYWVFSIYNAMNRRNAMDVFFRNNDKTGTNEAVRFSVVGSIVPAVSYNFKF